jgi:DNA-directed RNA polymerase beta' subunit
MLAHAQPDAPGSDGQPIVGPAKDMVLGVYYLTAMLRDGRKGEGRHLQ